MPPFFQPFFEAWCFFIEPACLADAAKSKTQFSCFLSDKVGKFSFLTFING